MSAEAFKNNPLANQICEIAAETRFTGFELLPVTDVGLINKVREAPLGGLDYRAKIEPTAGYASLFSGLAFDTENVRSQAFALCGTETDEVAGLMTVVIAPEIWALNQRYFERLESGVRVCDFRGITDSDLPNFVIIPAWTKVVDKYLSKFAVPGFRAFKKIIDLLQEFAPKNTWMEAIAQGTWPWDRRGELTELVNRGVNAFIPEEDLPFDLQLIGKNNNGSSSSVKLAPILELGQIEKLGSAVSLGPTFAKKVR